MTLRVKLEIVPFGNEDEVRVIKTFNISNLGDKGDKFGDYLYGVEVDSYKTGEYQFKVIHDRAKGAEELVRKTLEKYVDETQ